MDAGVTYDNLWDCTPELYRKVMGAFPTGVVVMTCSGNTGRRAGVTVNSFNTVSLTPPLLLWSLALNAPSLAAFRSSDLFAVSVLSEQQKDIALQFARPAANKFMNVETSTGRHDLPMIAGALTHIECMVSARYPGGDHEIMVGEVLTLNRSPGNPLVFHSGAFTSLDDLRYGRKVEQRKASPAHTN